MYRSTTTTSTAAAFRSEECSSSGSSNNLLIHRNFKTRHEASVFSLTSEEEDEEVQFDTTDTDDNCEVMMTGSGKQYPTIQEFASAIPNQLLLGSLLEHLCVVYERDPARSHMLFKAIGQRLAAMNLLSPLAISDEFSTVRLQHNRAFTELLHAASSSLLTQDPQLFGTDTQELTVRPKEGPKEGLFEAQISRYLNEFEEICRLGKGAYGKVFKVTNKLDGQNYAVKKILIKSVSRQDCMKVLREVKVLSSLQHVNVVGYHTAWMEHVQPALSSQPVLPSLKSPATQEGTDESHDSSGSGSSIVFQNSSHCEPDSAIAGNGTPTETEIVSNPDQGKVLYPKTRRCIPEHFVPCVFLGERQHGPVTPSACPAVVWDDSDEEEDSSKMRAELNNNSFIGMEGQQWLDKHAARGSFSEVQFHLMLYIQMQLCEHSLKDWISQRNAKCTDELASRCPYGGVDPEHTLGLLRKILEGVEYIHSRGIMHRDLKPRNIFLHGHDFHVRIGDFGLACRDIIVDESLPSSLHNTGSSHTTGVGTFVYAAPEQLQGTHYDSKSDMYSIGVVALELFQPFGTEMERVRTLENLREGKIPDAFCQRWPVLAKHVTKLTSKDPCVRPDATQLLCSELFSSKDMVIHGLQRRVEEQQEELIQLRRQISELQTQSSQNNVENSDST